MAINLHDCIQKEFLPRRGMRIGLGLELGSGVRVWVMARTSVGEVIMQHYCAISCSFTHSTLSRCRMGTALR